MKQQNSLQKSLGYLLELQRRESVTTETPVNRKIF